MSKKNVDNEKLRNDIYENLPCQAMFNESVRKINNKINNSMPTSASTNPVNNRTKHTNLSTKELLYATPLRKSDRYKSGERSRFPGNSNASAAGSNKVNNFEYKLLNKEKVSMKNGAPETSTDSPTANINHEVYDDDENELSTAVNIPNQQLEDRRILNFLKDTTQAPKKIEVGGKDCPNSSFSNLAREEHFANLVHQNFTAESRKSSSTNNQLDEVDKAVKETDNGVPEKEKGKEKSKDEMKNANNLEEFMMIKSFPGKGVNQIVVAPLNTRSIFINREWVLKKIALILEQRSAGKKSASGSSINQGGTPHSNYNGCLILGSNGSGKTSICQAIMNGNSGTKGILNRKLLACYLINSQNPNCHSLSLFLRSLILQILSHSSLINRDETTSSGLTVSTKDTETKEPSETESKLNEAIDKLKLFDDTIDGNGEIDFKNLKTSTKKIIRQKSAPSPEQHPDDEHEFIKKSENYNTHPPKNSNGDSGDSGGGVGGVGKTSSSSSVAKPSPGKKSKIPIPKNRKSSLPAATTEGGEDVVESLSSPTHVGNAVKNEIEKEINNKEKDNEGKDDAVVDTSAADEATRKKEEEEDKLEVENEKVDGKKHPVEKDDVDDVGKKETPLPKLKSCRTIIADSYYEILMTNPDILEALNVDNIERNPDECFKKIFLFPILEIQPPKQTLLILIDSIDENYINEGNLITTLKGSSTINTNSAKSTSCSMSVKQHNQNRSRNVAELLSNHIHLLPKWLFLVCTTKKQTKPITKMFTGFKKITLDDLRKSHVVKDVQEYIINRLNCDFKGSINLTKEVIESLHQLYIKSNGCILYLEKVLNGIRTNFFTFREIKLIPCTLNGLYLYICQKSFNKKQYSKIRPILNVLLAATGGCVDKLFLFNCLRTHNYTIDMEEFEKRLSLMRNIITYSMVNGQQSIQLFHSSFADWLVDVKFATKKFICDVNEGHVIIAMYYTLISETLCATTVRKYVYHLIKCGEYLTNKKIQIDLMVLLLESRVNLNDCLFTNNLNCCRQCEIEFKNDESFLPKTKGMVEKFLTNHLSDEFSQFLCDFFKPSLITDSKVLKLILESGASASNCGDNQTSCDSSILSPIEFSEKSPNIDFELADLLLSTEKSCYIETQRAKSPSEKSDIQTTKSLSSQVQTVLETPSNNDTTILAEYQEIGEGFLAESTLHQLSDAHRIELHKGKALIHILANDGNCALLDRALNACKGPVDLEIEDYNGQTALNIAARNGHLEVVKLLLEFTQSSNGLSKKVNINHADRDGWTALRSASWGGHTEVVKVLITHPGIEIDLADKEGRTALRAAAWSGHEDILKILIETGADVNSVDRQGRTSLIAASYMGHFEIVEILLENGANVNHLDLDGRSALCVAALCGSSGYSRVISTLLEHGANTDQVDNDGMSALLVSSFEGNDEVCELLLENGADPDLADVMGRTPLWAACTAGHANVVKLLLFWGCGIDCMDSEGRTVLSIAAAQGNVETIRQLLDRGLDETHRDNAGWTPLHYAAFEGFQDVCIQLIESGAKIDECDNEGKTALHLASQEGRHRCIEYLLGVHSIFVDQKAHDGKTAFRLAALEGHLDSVQTLLKYGCDVNTKDADCRTTLYILALENKLEVVKFLLEVSNVDVNMPDSEGRTALHVAAWQGHVEMVKLMITLGNADVNSMDLECRTPLHSCAWQGNHDVMGILLYFGAAADHACKQGATALGISAQEGHEKCVSILLKYGANPYKSDHCGRTPIKLAAKSNRSNILKIFESFTKNDVSNNLDQKVHQNMVRSPEAHHPSNQGFIPHQQPNLVLPNNHGVGGSANSILNASQSTHSSNNFYENTMRSDVSSLHKRKSVISSQSTGSSNDQTPLTFAQQLQRHSRRNSSCSGGVPSNSKYNKGQNRHSQVLPDLSEDQFNMAKAISSNDADLFDLECMSPLYATPPHSPTSELGSPMQLPLNGFDDHRSHNTSGTSSSSKPDSHFARDTHMRIILGNLKEQNQSQSKPKRSGITTNPAMRMIKSRFDAASQLIRRTNNMLSNSGQGSSSIGVKSGTFQWRKEGHN